MASPVAGYHAQRGVASSLFSLPAVSKRWPFSARPCLLWVMSRGLPQPILGEGVNAGASTEGRLLVVVRELLSTCQGVTYFESSRGGRALG